MIQCSVESCESNLNSDLRTSVTFFDFPRWKDSERFNKWVEALGGSPEYFKQKGKFICSRHFRLEDFQKRDDESMRDIKCSLSLLESAVPSLYLWEDNKNFVGLPKCDIKTEAEPSNCITDVSFIETEAEPSDCITDVSFIKTEAEPSNCITDVSFIKTEAEPSDCITDVSFIKTEAEPSDCITDVSFIKTEEGNEGFSEADHVDSASNNSSIINNEMLLEEEPQVKTECELNIEDHILEESQEIAELPPYVSPLSFQETQTKSGELGKKKFTCWECKETFSWSTELKKHKRVAHGTYVCNICLKHVVNLASLRVHKRTKHNISFVYNCEDCDEAFFKNKDLIKHMRTHKKVPNDRCTKCKKKFESEVECMNHDCIKKKKLFQCEICRRCFAGEKNLDTHKKKFHLKTNPNREQDKKYKCDVCNKTLKRRHGLMQHKRLHSKPYQCDTCKKEYSDKAALKVHQLNHSAVECIHLGHVKF